ncbi:MAG: hypothetical protein IAI49_09130, partial [Candidatus Eremiobacteraeota bacterium]|nr:hypothetical protein [Candidatus Eremiobacteraeota bacterium]
MMSRGTVVAALIAMELAVVGEGVVAVRAGLPTSSVRAADMRVVSGTRLAEDGAHQIFDAATSPALTVDIGYADLTIVASASSQIDVSLSGSSAFG